MKPLTAADLIIGNKYVPHTKSVFASLEDCHHWLYAKEINQQYLYYRGMTGNYHCFSCSNDANGDFFLPSDVTPYVEVEGKKQTAVEWLVALQMERGFLYDLDVEAALQMEREQIEEAYKQGDEDGYHSTESQSDYEAEGRSKCIAEQYYSKTFKNKL